MIGKDRWITATVGRHKLDSGLSDGLAVRALGSRVTGDSSGSQQNVCADSFSNFIRTLHLLLKLLPIICPPILGPQRATFLSRTH